MLKQLKTQIENLITQSGNVLIIILVAIALFAALTYAVFESGENSGDISYEETQLLATQILDKGNLYVQTIQRLQSVKRYAQVLPDDSAPTNSGTCYYGGTTVTPCRTIGLFHSGNNLATPKLPDDAIDPTFAADTHHFIWDTRQYLINGEHLGTTKTDIAIVLKPVTRAVCDMINQELGFTGTPGTISYPTEDNLGRTTINAYIDGTFSTPTVVYPDQAGDIKHNGCTAYASGRYGVYFFAEEN